MSLCARLLFFLLNHVHAEVSIIRFSYTENSNHYLLDDIIEGEELDYYEYGRARLYKVAVGARLA